MTSQGPPPKVLLASRLMWLLWAAGTLYLIVALISAIRLSLPGTAVLDVVYLSVVALLALLIWAVARGSNRARITYAVFAVLGICLLVLGWFRDPNITPVRAVASACMVVAYAAILWLLFHSSSAAWFRKVIGGAT